MAPRPDPGPASDPDVVLADLGAELAVAVAVAMPAWVTRCIDGLVSPSTPGRAQIMARAEVAGSHAQTAVAAQLATLLSGDVDEQRSTPLAVVRAAVTYPTEVLRDAQVPPVARDRFVSERFPDDPYGLTPATLQALDPGLGDLAIAWGAAKAMAHRRRHGDGEEFT